MTDRDAMLRAIAANPDDDTPRLIYADLLDELGGDANTAHARFIRLQIDLIRNPGRSWFANSERLCEVSRLAGQFADRWLDELPKWAANEARKQRLRADDFPRGFLDAFRLSASAFVAKGSELLAVAPTKRIVVADLTARADLTAFFSSPNLLNVRSLVLPSAVSNVVSYAKTSRVLWAIRELDLPGATVTDESAAVLAQATTLSNLLTLTARNSRLTESGAALLLSANNLANLRTLDLRGTPDAYRWVPRLQSRFPKKNITH